MNSYQNKKRKRNLAKKAKKKFYFNKIIDDIIEIRFKPWDIIHKIMFDTFLVYGVAPSPDECIDVAIQQGKISLSEGIALKLKLKDKSWGYKLK